ncbi:MAG TPA: pitrilysin family protein [Longimicrobiales bacterium]
MNRTFDRAAPPAIGPAPSVHPPNVRRLRLSNGLDVLVVQRHGPPIVDLRLVVRAGAAADTPDRAGRAGLAAEMLDEGTDRYGALELAEAVDRLGAELDVMATWDASVVTLHVLRRRLEPALELLAEVVAHPTFPEDELARVRAERLADLTRKRQEPRYLAIETFSAALYGPDHPYGATLSGTPESVQAIDREAVERFYRSHYRPGNAFLVAVGDVDPEALLARLERGLGTWEAGPADSVPPPPRPAPVPTAIYLVDKPGAAQSEIQVGHPAVPRSTPDFFPLLVMNTVLGGAFTSRLNMALREERGYTYGAGSRFDFRLGPGPFAAASAVFTGVTDDALAVVVEQIRRIREEPVPAEELERARNFVALGLPRQLETSGQIARTIADIELYGLGDDYLSRFVDRVRAVTAEDVRRVAREHLDPDHLALVVVGDRASIEGPLRSLGLGSVVLR